MPDSQSRHRAQEKASLPWTRTSAQETRKQTTAVRSEGGASLNATTNPKGVKSHIKYEEQTTPSVTPELPGEKGACREPSALQMQRSARAGALQVHRQTESEFCLLQICAVQAQGIKVFLQAGD